ncbi:PREDICTED: uncharacterized protein LOC109485253 [Branchiostoma belcheri]|uniref:Uncharacterized protein LOC109485253 n=1 Tax=Branchiostoma belcheri TaxID=7741 RepID=A0A6P5AMJ6_BRABE|nr:PREDICTED: uncharacterized protein LOC109485253 [Branchiostoma belcheri]XP_019644283.1 PREDICTED: uncharacterized protein LOC109485253 [Branchiostoma belcheri]
MAHMYRQPSLMPAVEGRLEHQPTPELKWHISKQDSEVWGSSLPDGKQREMRRDNHFSECCQDSSELLENTVADDNKEIRLRVSDSDLNNNEMNLSLSETDFNNNDEINLRGSESDIPSETTLDLSTTGCQVMASVVHRAKGTKRLNSEKTAVLGTLDKLKNASNISSDSDSSVIKKRKMSKYQNAKPYSSVESKTVTKHKNVTSRVDSNKDKSTRKTPVKEINTPRKKILKKRRVLNLLKSGSKLKSSNSSKPNSCEVVDKEGFSNCLPQKREQEKSNYNPKFTEKMDEILLDDMDGTEDTNEQLSVKGKGESRYSCRAYSVSKNRASNDTDREIEAHESHKEVARKSPRSQDKLTPKYMSSYDISFRESESDSFFNCKDCNDVDLALSSFYIRNRKI